MTDFRQADEAVSVAGQLAPEDFQRAADEGFALIVNNRPEGEAPDQIPDEEARALASAAGLAYAHVPIRMATLSLADVEAMERALAGAEGPVLAYCASGARSVALWAMTRVRAGADPGSEAGVNLEETMRGARAAGVDLEGLRPLLERLAAEADSGTSQS